MCRERMGAQPDLRDDGERAFGSEHELGEIGPDGTGRRAPGDDDRAVGEHELEPDHHRFDLPVARRVLTGATGCHPPADRREVEALWEVADRQAVVCLEHVLEVGAERPGHHLDDPRHVVDRHDARQCRRVEDDTAMGWNRCPAHAAAPTGRR